MVKSKLPPRSGSVALKHLNPIQKKNHKGFYFLFFKKSPIQFRREGQLQDIKRWLFLKNTPIHFHINSTMVIGLLNQNQLRFSSNYINMPPPALVYSVP